MRQEAEPAATSQRGAARPRGLKRSVVQTETPAQRYSAPSVSLVLFCQGIFNVRAIFRTKKPRQTTSGEVANRASTSQAPTAGQEAEASTRRAPDAPPTEDADRLSATNSEVESAMNHRRRRTVLRDACFSEEALDAFNSGDAYLRASQNGLARATKQYVKDIRVRKFW